MKKKPFAIAICSGLLILIGLCQPLFAGSSTPNQASNLFPSSLSTDMQLAKAESKDDGKATPASQTKAAKAAQKKAKGKVLKVQRGTGGYTVRVLTNPDKVVKVIWIAD